MSMTIRFHLDEHIHPGIAIGLRAHGIDVTTTMDAGLSGAEDPKHMPPLENLWVDFRWIAGFGLLSRCFQGF